MSNFIVSKAAVLGAGVMGAQIAAHLVNAGVQVVLYDLPAPAGDRSAIARTAIAGLQKLDPPPLALPELAGYIVPANYEDDLEKLAACDLVIEAIAERQEWKAALYQRIAPHLAANAILASNTSGLSIAGLAEALPAERRARFCGVHFFNPPRYMQLVELIAAPASDPGMLDALETWLVTRLGKSIVRALDTPNFIANRIGVFSLLATMHHSQQFGLGFDLVDALTGPLIGRPKSATYRTADLVGLDTLAHVVRTMHDTLPDDPWHRFFSPPDWLAGLIGKGALGQKSGGGIYRKGGAGERGKGSGSLRVFDPARQDYREAGGQVSPAVRDILRQKNPVERLANLRACPEPQAQFLWAVFRDLFHYSAFHLAEIAGNARDVDLAMRWGFGWAQGPFELWQAAGWSETVEAMQSDIDAGRTMSQAPLPEWTRGRKAVHAQEGSYAAGSDRYMARSALPVYCRQLCPDRVVGETPVRGRTLWKGASLRLWSLPEVDARIGIVSFTTKMHAISGELLASLGEALGRAGRELDALVIWQEAPFAVGADLREVLAGVLAGDFAALEQGVQRFQQASRMLKYSPVPVVAAVQGMALGGGCEILMHCARRVLALESYVGLVEAGVGLIPAGGGCKEMVVRAAAQAAQSSGKDPFAFIEPVFTRVAMAQVARSALEARQAGFADGGDTVVMHAQELLYVALREARATAEAGYRPPLPPRVVKVAGRTSIANCEMLLLNMREGGLISAHDYEVGKALALALCGGDIEAGSLVDEDWLLAVERQQFMQLLRTEKTQQRIRHMLDTGKPLRN